MFNMLDVATAIDADTIKSGFKDGAATLFEIGTDVIGWICSTPYVFIPICIAIAGGIIYKVKTTIM